MIYFSFSEFWHFYLGFSLFVVLMLLLDLGVFHKKSHEVSIKEASIMTGVWIALAFIFNLLLYFYVNNYITESSINSSQLAKTLSLEFLTGFIIEKSLAVDNIFVFAIVFSYFGIPKAYQHKVLFWGIFGALIFRAIFISIGSVLMNYHWVIVLFGVFLILTGIKMFFAGTKAQNLENSLMVKYLNKIFNVHPKIENDCFFIYKNGVRYVTPLFISLLFLEFTDIIFAIDSVPAIFSITKEPLIVFTSNIFAILGLRSMYFMLIGVIDKFVYIKYGLAAVLVFVGLKMAWLNGLFNGKFPISLSLMIIGTLIAGSILFSIIVTRKDSKIKKADL